LLGIRFNYSITITQPHFKFEYIDFGQGYWQWQSKIIISYWEISHLRRILQTKEKNLISAGTVVLKNGFRVFFLGAALFSIISISLWFAIYSGAVDFSVDRINIFQWHAHEMIFGYSMAVIAGFLITAVGNWTKSNVLDGWKLAVLFLIWSTGRILLLCGDSYLLVAGITDISFSVLLLITLAIPIIAARKWVQLGLLAKVLLLGIANLFFYLGSFGRFENGINIGIYAGLFLVIGIIITISRRVFPFFIERGVGYPIQLFNSRLLDICSLLGFLAFFIVEVFYNELGWANYPAGFMAVVMTVRIIGWYTPGIWRVPLLWSLFVALMFIDAGFFLFALSPILGVSKFVSVHAFAVGGIGVVTLAMMVRVSLGHTGRKIGNPPAHLSWILLLIISAGLVRVVFPIFAVQYYSVWIGISQLLWVGAFGWFVVSYLPILTTPRISSADTGGE